ncbi:MAG: hypothetical protein JST30_12255 [Armatimonadetes bacterium]|nr:hypothetical protein [Armatimonadota bacterium]
MRRSKEGSDKRTGTDRSWPWFAAVLLLAIAVRVVWLQRVDTQPVTDFQWYFLRAVSISQGHGYAVDGRLTAYWPVGYPGFLGLAFLVAGASVALGKVLNTVLVLACLVLTWRLGAVLFRSGAVGVGAAWVLAVHPAYVAYSGILASEPLYTALTLAGTLALLTLPVGKRSARDIEAKSPPKGQSGRKRLPAYALRALGAGLLFGAATLVRPQAAVLPLLVVVGGWLLDAPSTIRGRVLPVLAFGALGMSVFLVPWTLRNWSVFGTPVFVSTNGGDNLLIGNSPRSNGLYQNPDSLGYDFTGLGEVERDKRASRTALGYAKQNPAFVRSLWPAKLQGTFLNATDAAYWAFQKEQGVLRPPGLGADKQEYLRFREASRGSVPWLLALAGFGAVVGLFTKRLPLTALFFIGNTALLSMVFFGNPRFSFPVVPFLALFAASGIVGAVNLLNEPRRAPRAESDG